MERIDDLCVKTLRFLAVDQVEAARSGHPGMPLGAAPMAYVLFDRFLKHNPGNPRWFDRDRFILSAGHGSALLYAMLHLTGYDLPLDELRRFRQMGSRTPGHPEYGHTPGVDATTGPLGQGFAMGVGMAVAEAHLAAVTNRPGAEVVDHFTYAIVSDGDLMEGASSEAASLAGTLGLGKLVYLYDDNHISIEGSTDLAFTEDVAARFEAYHWHVQKVEDGNDLGAIEAAIAAARRETARPSLIVVRTHIGFGSPKQDTAGAHGEPLGADATKATKEAAGWPDEPFHVPAEVREYMGRAVRRGEAAEAEWRHRLASLGKADPQAAATFGRLVDGRLPDGWESRVPQFPAGGKPQATRSSSGTVINALAGILPELVGGSADLAPSTKTLIKDSPGFSRSHPEGRNLHFGVRELAMGAMVNGMALHGGIRPYGATFLVFSDFARPAIRLAALMQCPSLFVFTHDSVGVGEDGPTHQPVEHALALRAIPGLLVFRPADANETAETWRTAIALGRPAAFLLTRQDLPVLDAAAVSMGTGFARGGYVLSDPSEGTARVVLAATGSEVSLALQARDLLAADGIPSRVVSIPCRDLFEEQDGAYRRSVLPSGVPVLTVEAGRTMGWRAVAGSSGDCLGIDRFGESAPGKEVFRHFGFTPENVAARARALVKASES